MSKPGLQTARYSPGNLAPEALERLFVGRSGLMDELLEKLSRSIRSRDKQHFLLVGPRGIGKTHFMALLHQRLVTDPGLAAARERATIAYLSEEEWGVASFLDFMLAILRSIQAGSAEIGRQIALVEETFERDPGKARDLAEDALLQAVGDRTLVLLCENLHDLFDELGPEGQARWRALVQEHRSWCIVATTPELFSAISRQTEPFYGFFTIRSLAELSVEDAVELQRRKAELEGRHDLAEALDTPLGRARVRAIHHMVGGNHRAYIVLSERLTRDSLDELVAPFMNMVDDLTPYYQERMRSLMSPLQRKLVAYLCRQRRPATVKGIARATLVQPQSAAKQLGELAKLGIVQRTARGRESFYELADPLVRICIELRGNRAAYVAALVALLRDWFASRDLESSDSSRVAQRTPGSAASDHEEPSDLEVSAVASTRMSRARATRRVQREAPIHEEGLDAQALEARLWPELRARGPLAFADRLVVLSARLPKARRTVILLEAVSSILRRLVRTQPSVARSAEWGNALAVMASRLPELEGALPLFSVGVRYMDARDDALLLELPLEQRQLLMHEIKKDSAPPH